MLGGTNVLDKVEQIVTTAMPEVIGSNEDEESTRRTSVTGGQSETFRTCNKSTYAVYFRSAFAALVEQAKKIPGSHGGPGVANAVAAQAELTAWDQVLALLDHLVTGVKNSESRRSVLTACLKQGRILVDLFYKTAMPLLDKQFKNYPQQSQELFRKLQKGTRTLQQVCNHAKTSRDSALAAHIPAWKRTQELLLFRVRSMLAANGCADAFWMGNLKNKDLKGQEITSPVVSDDDDDGGDQDDAASTDQDEEEDQPARNDDAEEEEDDDVTVLNEDLVCAAPALTDEDSRSREF